ncbi:MAG: stage III sporulation protein AC [Acutalibacteraceae bacterium]|nr:stage III sporulation protein AC [Acutalibacteraceae bacterium]
MELVIKIAAVGVIVAVLQQILSRSGRDDYAMIMVLAGIVTAVAMLLREVSDVFDSVSSFLSF